MKNNASSLTTHLATWWKEVERVEQHMTAREGHEAAPRKKKKQQLVEGVALASSSITPLPHIAARPESYLQAIQWNRAPPRRFDIRGELWRWEKGKDPIIYPHYSTQTEAKVPSRSTKSYCLVFWPPLYTNTKNRVGNGDLCMQSFRTRPWRVLFCQTYSKLIESSFLVWLCRLLHCIYTHRDTNTSAKMDRLSSQL